MRIITPSFPDSKWLKASVIASFWASFEIIAGSFLHNLRIPMSGTILSFISVVLVVSFVSRWKLDGIVLRAGLICALLKSISPSGIILGPIIGITSEAFFLELFILLFGHNLFGYLVGGAFAVLSALIHKIITLLILYGFDLVKIFLALYHYSVKQIGLQGIPAVDLVMILIAIYLFAGMSASFLGYLIGRKSTKLQRNEKDIPGFELDMEKYLFSRSQNESFSLGLLVLNFVSVVAILTGISLGYEGYATVLAVIYLVFVTHHYRNSLRHLKKPGFWIQFILITLIASVLMDGLSEGKLFSINGLIVGLMMNLRAILVVFGFSTISCELRNPVIRIVSIRAGYSRLYQSVNLAFSALPEVLKAFPGKKAFFLKPMSTLSRILYNSETLIRAFEKSISDRGHVIIITGDRQQGKSQFVMTLLPELHSANIPTTGFLALGVNEGNRRIGFDLYTIPGGEKHPLCREIEIQRAHHHSRFEFFEDAMRLGNQILEPSNIGAAKVIIVDEVGPIEMKNGGWANAIRRLCQHQGIIQLWTVRKQLVDNVAAAWPVGEVFVFDISTDSVGMVVQKILELNGKQGVID